MQYKIAQMRTEPLPARITEKWPFCVLPKSEKRAESPFFAISTTPIWIMDVNLLGKKEYFFFGSNEEMLTILSFVTWSEYFFQPFDNEPVHLNGKKLVCSARSSLLCEALLLVPQDALVIQIDEYKTQTMHYRLRSIKRGQFRFSNFASHFKQKSYFHFLIH